MSRPVEAVIYPAVYEKGRLYVKAFGVYAVVTSLIGIAMPSTMIRVFNPFLKVIEDALHLPTPSANVTPEQHAFYALAFTFTLAIGGIYATSAWPLWERGGKLLVEVGLWTRLIFAAASWSFCLFTPYGTSFLFLISSIDLLSALLTMWGLGIGFPHIIRGLARTAISTERPVKSSVVKSATQGLVFPRKYDAARVAFLGDAAYAIFGSAFTALYPEAAMRQLGPILKAIEESTGMRHIEPSTIEEQRLLALSLMFSSAIGAIHLVLCGPYWNRGGKALVEASFWTRSIYIAAAYTCCFLTPYGSALLFTVASFDILQILLIKMVAEASWSEFIFGGTEVVSVSKN
ncbi:hypothetical protein OBBRIDRAFT_798490, partial [Obba rivulosa]